MFIGIKMRDDIPTKEDFIRKSIDLDRSKGWELISASTIMKKEFKYSGAKFEICLLYTSSALLLGAEHAELVDIDQQAVDIARDVYKRQTLYSTLAMSFCS